MKYSFIIPALNEEDLIGKTIKSIKRQKGSFEIVVVDNGSTDKTAKIAKDLGCRVVKEKQKGISPARNKGAKVAKGEYLCFIDADGELIANWLERGNRIIMKKKPDVVGGLVVFKHNNILKIILYNSYSFVFYFIGVYFARIFLNMPFFPGNNCVIKRKFFSKTSGFEPIVNEDMWLSKKFWKLGGKIYFNPKMVIRYSSRGFDEAGFLKTIIYWISSYFIRKDSNNYSYKNKK